MLKLLLATVLSCSVLSAQTTGVPGVNDLRMLLPPTYLPQGSGATSCNNLGFIPGAPFVAAYDLTVGTGTAAILLLDFVSCTPAGLGLSPSAAPACAGPLAGTPLTNLWYSLNLTPAPIPVPGFINTTGMARWNFNIPAGPGFVWAQAFILDACSPWGFKFSQAHGFSW